MDLLDTAAEGEQVQHLEFWYKLVSMGMASKLGETEQEASFRGNGKSSICPLDIHLEMADRELSNVEKCLYLL